jgi:hypothetical protein
MSKQGATAGMRGKSAKQKDKTRKEVTICFRTDSRLRNALKRIADGEKRSLSSLIETLIIDHVEKKSELDHLGVGEERRRWKRRDVAIPAFVTRCGKEATTYPATIQNVSLGGLRISLNDDCLREVKAGAENYPFEAFFALPQNQRPIRVQCKASHVVPREGDYAVGAAFTDAAFSDYQAFEQYLMQTA